MNGIKMLQNMVPNATVSKKNQVEHNILECLITKEITVKVMLKAVSIQINDVLK